MKAQRPDKKLRWFVQDEARLGQQGTLTRVWARTGSRPSMVKQTEYDWVYLWAAVEPATGASVAMITSTVNTDLMNRFLSCLAGGVVCAGRRYNRVTLALVCRRYVEADDGKLCQTRRGWLR